MTEALVRGPVRVITRNQFSPKGSLRELPEGSSISFSEGETFAIRGRSDEMGFGIHIIQALGPTTLTGPAIMDARKWRMEGVDKSLSYDQAKKPVILSAAFMAIILVLMFHSYLQKMLPVFLIFPIMFAQFHWPKEAPKDLEGIAVRGFSNNYH